MSSPPDVQALNELAAARVMFLDRYSLLSALHRRFGGQSVVQFADTRPYPTPGSPRAAAATVVSAALTAPQASQVAIKFVLQRAAFERELQLYADERLQGLMPKLVESHASTGSGTLRTPQGVALPPVIVTERGQSLDEWSRRVQPDFITCLQVRAAGNPSSSPCDCSLLRTLTLWLEPRLLCAALGRSRNLECTLAPASLA